MYFKARSIGTWTQALLGAALGTTLISGCGGAADEDPMVGTDELMEESLAQKAHALTNLSPEAVAALTATPESSTPDCGGPTQKPPLRNHQGPLIKNVRTFNIGWGTIQDGAELNTFMGWISSSAYVGNLGHEYDDSKARIGAGSFAKGFAAGGNPGRSVTVSQIQNKIDTLVRAGKLPDNNDGNDLYFVWLPKGTRAYLGKTPSCASKQESCFCAYHSAYRASSGKMRYYAVMPDLTDAPGRCGGPGNDFGDRTVAVSHELAEAITDPAPFDSWYTDGKQEIGDLCNGADAHQHKNRYRNGATHNYWVQCEWSNRHKGCVDSL